MERAIGSHNSTNVVAARRKGESGSVVVAVGVDKMRGVVEEYTGNFFNLAHCFIVNGKEHPSHTGIAGRNEQFVIGKKELKECQGGGGHGVSERVCTGDTELAALGGPMG